MTPREAFERAGLGTESLTRILAVLGGAFAIIWSAATAFGFQNVRPEQRFQVLETTATRNAKHIEENTARLGVIEGRLDGLTRLGCIPLTERERELAGVCARMPLTR